MYIFLVHYHYTHLTCKKGCYYLIDWGGSGTFSKICDYLHKILGHELDKESAAEWDAQVNFYCCFPRK